MRSFDLLSDAPAGLICFPHAGGSAAFFSPWKKAFDGVAQILPFELAGRGARFGEAPASRMADVAHEAAAAIDNWDRRGIPLMLYGHSMGALLAYETARRLHATEVNLRGLVLTGMRAPHRLGARSPQADVSDEDLIRDMRALGGTRDEVFQSPELLSLMLPVLRADRALLDNYRPRLPELLPELRIPARIFGGDRDERNPPESLMAWRALFAAPVEIRLWPGGHFFIQENQEKLFGVIREVIHAPPLSGLNG